jgi:hypothetical protein
MTVRERRRHEKLAQTRRPLTRADFIGELVLAGVPGDVAEFVWNEFQPYYFSPLTPYPTDRPIGEIKIDGDDLSDIVQKFEKDFQRPWRGQWIGPNDPT